MAYPVETVIGSEKLITKVIPERLKAYFRNEAISASRSAHWKGVQIWEHLESQIIKTTVTKHGGKKERLRGKYHRQDALKGWLKSDFLTDVGTG